MRRGAKLNAAEQKRLSDINQELAALFSEFSAKVLADENTWTVLDREAELAGLPDVAHLGRKAAADERGLAGKWAIVNTRSSVDPFLTFSTGAICARRSGRSSRTAATTANANDTNAMIARIVKLRAERAKLLGFPSHAHWRMADTMAHDPKARAGADDAGLAGGRRAREGRSRRHAGDRRPGRRRRSPSSPGTISIYAEKVRKAKYDLDQAS